MATFLTILLIINVIVLIILVVGLQHGNEGGMGAAFGAGNSTGFFGASGGVTFIVRATWIAATLFFVLSFALSWIRTREHYGVGHEINQLLSKQGAENPATKATATSTTTTVTTGTAAPTIAPTPTAK